MSSEAQRSDSGLELVNVYCAPLRHGWMVHIKPTALPEHLAQCFDENLETRAMELDFEDLHRFMAEHDAPYEKRISSTGGVELLARGASAQFLATWLSTALFSGIRVK